MSTVLKTSSVQMKYLVLSVGFKMPYRMSSSKYCWYLLHDRCTILVSKIVSLVIASDTMSVKCILLHVKGVCGLVKQKCVAVQVCCCSTAV